MSIITLHSYRRGVGKTTCIVNLAVLMAQQGYRVGIISQHILKLWELADVPEPEGLDATDIPHCQIPLLWPQQQSVGQLMVILGHYHSTLDVQQMAQELEHIQHKLKLDYLFIELIKPLQSNMLSNVALCDVLILMLGLDQTDVQHTAVIADIAQQLGVTTTFLLMSQTPPSLDSMMLHEQIQGICPLSRVGIFPWVPTMALGNQDVFCLIYPDAELTQRFQGIVDQIIDVTTPLKNMLGAKSKISVN
ncbi:MAG: hypothetical protein F6J87_17250 [Spirulina sp. SIO3F2]|nr:hypothetical protein [Spirulina sp. SIO3F2]